MSIQGEITRLETAKSAIAAAIAGKGVTVPDGTMLDGMADLIAGIEAGGGGGGSGGASSPVCLKDVNFYDYDGTLIASYTIAEAQALTALPDGPTHDGLTFQGWNWTLEKVKALTRPMNVGAMYITDDGKTRLYIHIADKARSTVPLYLQQTVANGVTIDWGDGSATETLSGTGKVNTSHAYGIAGDFVISLEVADGCTLGLGNGSSSYCVMGSTGNNSKVYCNMLQSVYIGENVTSIGNYAFQNCYSLASINIPNSVTSIGNNALQNCCSLASINIPNSVTSIGNYALQNCYSLASINIPDSVTRIGTSLFSSCYSLASINIPDSVTSIGNNAFSSCYSLASITIPDSVTSIGNYVFRFCYGMAEYHLKPVTPPTLSSTNAFNDIPSDCLIYVPSGSLNAYQTATNWSSYADYMREEAA